jgi:hypothetical protein
MKVKHDAGRSIEPRYWHPAKTLESIRESLEPVANTTVRRDWHKKKHFEHRISTDFGIRIEGRDEQYANTSASIR